MDNKQVHVIIRRSIHDYLKSRKKKAIINAQIVSKSNALNSKMDKSNERINSIRNSINKTKL